MCAGTIDRDLLYCEILSELVALIDANNNGRYIAVSPETKILT